MHYDFASGEPIFANGAVTAAFATIVKEGGAALKADGKGVKYFDKKEASSPEFSPEERIKLKAALKLQTDELQEVLSKAKSGDAKALGIIRRYFRVADLDTIGQHVDEITAAAGKFKSWKFHRLFEGDGKEAAHFSQKDGVIRLSKTVFDNIMSGRSDYSLLHEIIHYAAPQYDHLAYNLQKNNVNAVGGVAHARVTSGRSENLLNPYAYQGILEEW